MPGAARRLDFEIWMALKDNASVQQQAPTPGEEEQLREYAQESDKVIAEVLASVDGEEQRHAAIDERLQGPAQADLRRGEPTPAATLKSTAPRRGAVTQASPKLHIRYTASVDTDVMSRPPSIALISETHPPEVNWRRQYPGAPACRSPAAWPSGPGGAPAPARRRRPAQRRRAGADPRLAVARLPRPAMGHVEPAQAAALLEAPAPGRALHRHRRPARLLCPARRAAPGHPGGQRLPHQLPAVQRALRLRSADPAGHRLPALVPQPHADDPGAQRQPAHGIAAARFRTSQPALPRGRQPTLPSLPARSRTTPALGPGRTGHRRVARHRLAAEKNPRPALAAPSARSAPPIRS